MAKMFLVQTTAVQIHLCGDTTIQPARISEFDSPSRGRPCVSAHLTMTNGNREHELVLFADDAEQLAALGWAILGAAAQLRPVAPPQTEAHAALEAHADAESGAVAGVGVGG